MLPVAASTTTSILFIRRMVVDEDEDEEEDDEEEKAEEGLLCFRGMHFPESDLDSAIVVPKDLRPLDDDDDDDDLRCRVPGLIASGLVRGCSVLAFGFSLALLSHDSDESNESGPCCSFFPAALTPLSFPGCISTEALFTDSGTRLLRDEDFLLDKLDLENDNL